MEETKEIQKKTKTKESKKISFNYWMISTILLAVLLIIVLISGGLKGVTGNVISETEAGNKIVEFAKTQGIDTELVDVKDLGDLYEITLLIQGQKTSVDLTKDGKYFGSMTLIDQLSAQNSSQQNQEIPKSENPQAELFIWSYCPSGVTALTPFAEVAELLKDKADFKVVLYYDGHGKYETQQNKIQACIQKYAPAQYWSYAVDFVEKVYPQCGYSKDINCDKDESVKIMNALKIDSNKILDCINKEGTNLISTDSQRANSLGITGSPSLVINNVYVEVARNSESFKNAICSAFNNMPTECAKALSSSQTSASGSC